jgi:anti-sigma factor RsiW
MAESGQHITCQDVVELVTDYLEVALPPDEVALLEQHLNFCEGCVFYVEQMRATMQTVGRVGGPEMPDETRQRLLAVFRDWKRS